MYSFLVFSYEDLIHNEENDEGDLSGDQDSISLKKKSNYISFFLWCLFSLVILAQKSKKQKNTVTEISPNKQVGGFKNGRVVGRKKPEREFTPGRIGYFSGKTRTGKNFNPKTPVSNFSLSGFDQKTNGPEKDDVTTNDYSTENNELGKTIYVTNNELDSLFNYFNFFVKEKFLKKKDNIIEEINIKLVFDSSLQNRLELTGKFNYYYKQYENKSISVIFATKIFFLGNYSYRINIHLILDKWEAFSPVYLISKQTTSPYLISNKTSNSRLQNEQKETIDKTKVEVDIFFQEDKTYDVSCIKLDEKELNSKFEDIKCTEHCEIFCEIHGNINEQLNPTKSNLNREKSTLPFSKEIFIVEIHEKKNEEQTGFLKFNPEIFEAISFNNQTKETPSPSKKQILKFDENKKKIQKENAFDGDNLQDYKESIKQHQINYFKKEDQGKKECEMQCSNCIIDFVSKLLSYNFIQEILSINKDGAISIEELDKNEKTILDLSSSKQTVPDQD